jgi:hypothetical protein
MPYKMGFYENQNGKSMGPDSPVRVVFSIEYREFFGPDIYRFVGDVTTGSERLMPEINN